MMAGVIGSGQGVGQKKRVHLHVGGPRAILPQSFITVADLEQTWNDILAQKGVPAGIRSRIRVRTWQTAKRQRSFGQNWGWTAEMHEPIGEFIGKYTGKRMDRFNVMLILKEEPASTSNRAEGQQPVVSPSSSLRSTGTNGAPTFGSTSGGASALMPPPPVPQGRSIYRRPVVTGGPRPVYRSSKAPEGSGLPTTQLGRMRLQGARAGPAGGPRAGPAGGPRAGPAGGPRAGPAGGPRAGPAGGPRAGPAGGPRADPAGGPRVLGGPGGLRAVGLQRDPVRGLGAPRVYGGPQLPLVDEIGVPTVQNDYDTMSIVTAEFEEEEELRRQGILFEDVKPQVENKLEKFTTKFLAKTRLEINRLKENGLWERNFTNAPLICYFLQEMYRPRTDDSNNN